MSHILMLIERLFLLAVGAILVHTALVQLAAVWITKLNRQADVEMTRLGKGRQTRVDITARLQSDDRLRVKTADASNGLANALPAVAAQLVRKLKREPPGRPSA